MIMSSSSPADTATTATVCAMLWEKEPPAYLGMIGSRRRVAGLKDVLEEEGISRKWLDNICTPIA